jgi:NADPH-dependent F420 reductase
VTRGPLPTLAVIGGTGALGRGLAFRWAGAGYPTIIGSRSAEAAEEAARRIALAAGGGTVQGLANRQAAEAADIIVLTIPYGHRDPVLADIKEPARGKIVIDATVPISPPKVSTVRMPAAGSAAQGAQQALGPEVRVVSAFHTVAAAKLQAAGPIDGDVLVSGDDEAARAVAIALVQAAGMRGLHAGPLANSVAAEALASVLIGINRRYKVDGAGLRIAGDLVGTRVPDPDAAAWAPRR